MPSSRADAVVEEGKLLGRTQGPIDREAGPEFRVTGMAEPARPWARRFRRTGLAVSGLVKEGRWRAVHPGTLAVPDRFALFERAEAALGVPITLRGDAQAAAWGGHLHGAGRGEDTSF